MFGSGRTSRGHRKSLLHVRKYLLLARSRFLRTSLVSAAVVTIMKSMINRQTKFSVWYIFVAVWGVLLLHHLWAETAQVEQIPYSQFESYLNEGRIAEVQVSQEYIQGKLKDPQEGHPQQFVTIRVEPELAKKLAAHQVKFSGEVDHHRLRQSCGKPHAGNDGLPLPRSIFYLEIRRHKFGAYL